MKTIRLILILLALYGVSCQKDPILPESGFEEVTLKNLSGFDGCGFVFQKKNGDYLEPTNKKDFTIVYSDGKKYWIKYKIDHNNASICMVGDIIKIVELSDEAK